MRKIVLITLIFFALAWPLEPAEADSLSGRVLLQVEENGEAWYVYPRNNRRYFLGRPQDAFQIMRKLGLGARHDFLNRIEGFPDRVLGMILLDVESRGEAYYINPRDRQKIYLGRPQDAFQIMSKKGLGIKNKDLKKIFLGDINNIDLKIIDSVKIIQDVPFSPQAPFGDWTDQRQQDGCEEASSLMAVYWARGLDLSLEKALEEISVISDYELKNYGEYRDISLADTYNWILKDYFGFKKAILKSDISKDDIIEELKQGKIVITPMNGQILENPYFTPPGPPRHMLVIRGYDFSTNTFITNDPGTKRGEDYSYHEDVLWNAVRDYPTGYHEPILEIKKSMIVVSK